MGSPVRRFLRARLRTLLIISGAATAILTLGAFALVDATGSARSASAAQSTERAAAPPGDAPRTDPAPDPAPSGEAPSGEARADRGRTAAPDPAPAGPRTPKKKTEHDDPDTQAARGPEPERETAKKKPAKVLESGSCEASYYWQGQMTASGETFDPSGLTAAHKKLPFGSKVRVTNKNNGRSVTVRINDRGPFISGRCLDLSKAAMEKVGGTGSGVIPVEYEVLSRG